MQGWVYVSSVEEQFRGYLSADKQCWFFFLQNLILFSANTPLNLIFKVLLALFVFNNYTDMDLNVHPEMPE